MWRDQIIHFDVVDSTMTPARLQAAAGAPQGTVIHALRQTSGRGRSGHAWQSPAGFGLYFTVIFRPQTTLGLSELALVMGAGLLTALHQLGASCVQVKWPNDLVVGPHKLAGILTELVVGDNPQDPTVLAGIGINLLPLPKGSVDRPHVGLWTLCPKGPEDKLLGHLLDALQAAYAGWQEGGLEPTLRIFSAHHALADQAVYAQGAHGEPIFGTVLGIAKDGGLRLATPNGEQTVYAGDVHKVRPTG